LILLNRGEKRPPENIRRPTFGADEKGVDEKGVDEVDEVDGVYKVYKKPASSNPNDTRYN